VSWPPKMPLVLVEWLDSNGTHTWESYDTMLASCRSAGLLCQSVGWVLLDAPDRLVLVPNLAETGSVQDAMTIPRCAVLSTTILDLP
jgi:hypothetical protein